MTESIKDRGGEVTSKFIQILNLEEWLIALDDKGQVWKFIPQHTEYGEMNSLGGSKRTKIKAHWIKLSDERGNK